MMNNTQSTNPFKTGGAASAFGAAGAAKPSPFGTAGGTSAFGSSSSSAFGASTSGFSFGKKPERAASPFGTSTAKESPFQSNAAPAFGANPTPSGKVNPFSASAPTTTVFNAVPTHSGVDLFGDPVSQPTFQFAKVRICFEIGIDYF